MNDGKLPAGASAAADSLPGDSAGARLRAAREKQGLHIAALAAAIKVSPRKLEALENDRWGDLPDATFARALAQTVCRTLKVDPKPVLDRLPPVGVGGLEQVAGRLNAPFQGRGAEGPGLGSGAIRPMVWAAGLLMLAAVVLYLLPEGVMPSAPAPSGLPASAPIFPPEDPASAVPAESGASGAASAAATSASTSGAASATMQGMSLPSTVDPGGIAASAARAVAPVAAAAAPAPAPNALPSAAVPVPPGAALEGLRTGSRPAEVGSPPAGERMDGAGLLRLRTTTAPSWVEARDANDTVLVSRLLQAGESLALNGALPIRITIGNAAATEVFLRGQRVDLAPRTLDNIARLQLR